MDGATYKINFIHDKKSPMEISMRIDFNLKLRLDNAVGNQSAAWSQRSAVSQHEVSSGQSVSDGKQLMSKGRHVLMFSMFIKENYERWFPLEVLSYYSVQKVSKFHGALSKFLKYFRMKWSCCEFELIGWLKKVKKMWFGSKNNVKLRNYF